MGRDITSLRGLIYVDGIETMPRQLTSMQLEAIARQVEKLWPPNPEIGIWFDVETLEKTNNYWIPALIVACYYLPDKVIRAIIPEQHLQTMLNRKIRIYPDVQQIPDANPHIFSLNFEEHFIEIMFELE